MISWPRELFKKYFFDHASFQKKVSGAFSNFYHEIESSHAFSQFCLDIHGRRVPQFNLMDHVQWEAFLGQADLIPFKEGDSYLDLGCGLGYLTEEVASRYGLRALGYDFSSKAIQLARDRCRLNKSLVTFEEHNFHHLKAHKTFKLITSFDGLYGIKKWPEMIEVLLELLDPGGSALIFQSCVVKGPLEKGPLFESLKGSGLGVSWRFWEFTERERLFYEQSKKVLARYRPIFEREGLHRVVSIKEKECEKGLFWHQKKLSKRYFVTLTKNKLT